MVPDSPVKILIVHNRYRSAEPGGEDRVVDQEAAALDDAGHVVERFERQNDVIEDMTLAQKAVLPARVLWSEQSRRSLTGVLRTLRPDVVHLHNTFPLLSPSVLYACRAERVPLVATLHNYRLVCPSGALYRDGAICHDCVGKVPLPAIHHGCYKSPLATAPVVAELVMHRPAWRSMVSAFVCISASQRTILVEGGLPAERLFVKHNFVPALARVVGPRQNTVVYAGRLTTSKGIPLLMEAWDRLTGASPNGVDLRLVIAGTGPMKTEVGEWAARRPSVEYVGLLDRQACATLLSSARAAVVPSEWEEPFGLIAVEAMSVGVAPVAPARGSFPELIADGHDGVLYEAGSAAALAAVFSDIASDPQRYDRLGDEARATYVKRFTPEATVERLRLIYHFAITDGG